MCSAMRCRAAWTSSKVTIMGTGDATARRKIAQAREASEPAPRTFADLPLLQPPRQLDPVSHAELVEDRLEVALHGLRGDPEPLCHLARAEAVGDEQRHLPFTLGEPVRDRLRRR